MARNIQRESRDVTIPISDQDAFLSGLTPSAFTGALIRIGKTLGSQDLTLVGQFDGSWVIDRCGGFRLLALTASIGFGRAPCARRR